MQKNLNVHLILNELNLQLIFYLLFTTTNHLDHNGINVQSSHFCFLQSKMIQTRLCYLILPKNFRIFQLMNSGLKKIVNFLNEHLNFLVLSKELCHFTRNLSIHQLILQLVILLKSNCSLFWISIIPHQNSHQNLHQNHLNLHLLP